MHIRKLLYPLLFIALIISSCKKKKSPEPTPVVVKPFVTDVYVAGFKVINGATYGVYWKDGQQVSITSDINSTIYAVLTVGADVYLAGHTSVGATYWKNGQPVYLAQGNFATAYAIAVSGSDIYVGGTVLKPGDMYGRAVYWKNGIETDLTDGTAYANVDAIAVSGTDVYTAGQNNQHDYGNTAGISVAACWKNQTLIPLNGALILSYGSFAKGIAVSGNDVYVAGYIAFGAALWKNGVLQPLLDNSGYPLGSDAFTVGINGSDIYVGGGYGNEAAYWKNGVRTNLVNGAFVSSGVGGICFRGSDVYMCGGLNGPVYWKNDTAYTLQNGGESYVANSIAVSRHQ
jgi:hypothetical protein